MSTTDKGPSKSCSSELEQKLAEDKERFLLHLKGFTSTVSDSIDPKQTIKQHSPELVKKAFFTGLFTGAVFTFLRKF